MSTLQNQQNPRTSDTKVAVSSKIMSHKSRNTMAYKTNSVHTIKTRKGGGGAHSGELY